MNWTGGRLQRSKHAANGLSAKQKQHFAAARARLQGGRGACSPPYVTLFKGTDREVRLLRHEHATNTNGREQYGSRERVVESDSVAAQDNRKRRPPSESAEEPVSKRRKTPSVEFFYTGNEDYKRNVRSKKQHHGLPEAEDELQAARLGILDMMKRDDWLEPKVAKPLQMTFPSFEEKQKVGRRRKLTKADMKHRNQAIHQRVTPVKMQRSGLSRLPWHKPHVLDRDQVSVRLGSVIHGSQRTERSAVVAPVNENLATSDEMLDGSVYSLKESHSPHRLGTQPTSSDEMLMDSIHSFEAKLVNSIPSNEILRESLNSDEMLMDSEYSSKGKLANSIRSDNLPMDSMHSDEMLMNSIHSEELLIGSLNSNEMPLSSTYSSDASYSTEQHCETRGLTLKFGVLDEHSRLNVTVNTGEDAKTDSGNPGLAVVASKPVKADYKSGDIKLASDFHPPPDISIAKDETQEMKNEKLDEEAIWFKWVFGYDKTNDEEDEVLKLSTHNLLVETAADTLQDQREDDASSVIAEASQTPPEASTTPVSKNSSMSNQVDTSPDPLSIDAVSSHMDLGYGPRPGRLQPRVVFKKPGLFRGQKPPTATIYIGKNVNSSPVRDNDRSGWRKSRSERRRQSQMTFLQRSSDGEEEIED